MHAQIFERSQPEGTKARYEENTDLHQQDIAQHLRRTQVSYSHYELGETRHSYRYFDPARSIL